MQIMKNIDIIHLYAYCEHIMTKHRVVFDYPL